MKIVVYYRVNHTRGRPGPQSLDAQQRLVEVWVRQNDGDVVDELFEIERPRMRDRPVLSQAMDLCRSSDATLLIAAVGELAGNLFCLRRLAHAGIRVRAADLPAFTETAVPALLDMALYRRAQVGRRVRWGLDLARSRGRPTASEPRLSPEAAARGRQCGARERMAAADRFARKMYPVIERLVQEGKSLNAVARLFNAQQVPSATGKTGVWAAATVRNLVLRAEKLGLVAGKGEKSR